ncbi:DUF2290 domain-containing protein [Paraburkholderia phenoliruptrix]|uniref:DUF2290 domain-containing protein n=1 Tax=Paraburkholderia phenoliruptrix TaxID=252970 RepID=UPI00285B7296|nr:DUF2290 domain-containing protein [Paraburkholderia phenoliruptrix]MDR6387560.1 hypothetical protein [Paraburkholderia phenoliruptrix]
MDRSDVVRGINRTWETAERLDIAETFGNAGPLPVKDEFRDLLFSADTLYVDAYLAGLSMSHYNVLLSDYSYFQFSWEREGYVRYAFYPNPFISGKEEELANFKRLRELVVADMITHEEYLALIADGSVSSGVPMFRYENAPDQRKPFRHPCSHFHIGFHSENRWPLRRVLTPLAFSLMVFKAYYGLPWKAKGDDEQKDVSNVFERMLIEEKANCRLVSIDLFDEIEERTFFFA